MSQPRPATALPSSSLSTLPRPSSDSPSSPSPPRGPPPTATRTKVCPACNKSVASTSFSGHINNKTCSEALTLEHLDSIGYVRCTVADCQRIFHSSRIQSHISSHAPEDVPVPSAASSPVSSPMSASRSPPPVSSADFDPLPSILPTVPDWLQTWPHLFTYIPRIAHDVWTSICSAKLGEIFDKYRLADHAARDTLILEFLQLPRLLLGRVANQSRAHKRLSKTLHEHLSTGHSPPKPPDPLPSADLRDEMTRRIAAANRKVAQGHVGKALQALLQPGVLEITVETIEQLQQLHPDHSKPISLEDVLHASTVAKLWLKKSDIGARPDRFYDNGAAPGPSGWTGAMLRPLLNNDTCRRGLATLFSLIINGEISTPAVREALRAARLIPVPKGTGGLRPIAIGELFARIASVFALPSSAQLQDVFSDGIQLGLGVKSGVERAVLKVQALVDKHIVQPDIIAISTDIRNAFNTVHRSRIMSALADNPETRRLCSLFEWSHGGPSCLLLYGQDRSLAEVILSQEGVQQGHPLGTLCFDMAIHPDYAAVQAEFSSRDVRLVAIHDDLTIVGPASAAFAAFDSFARRLAARGDLELQRQKCRVLIPTTDEKVMDSIREQAEDREMAVHLGAMKLHGGCVGSDQGKMQIALQEAVSSFDAALKAVSDERMRSQVAWHIIRQCVVNGVGFYARITQPQVGQRVFEEFDRKVIKAISVSHSLPPGLHVDEDRKLLLASLGIAESAEISPIAYMSCLLSSLVSLPELSPDSSTYKALRDAHGYVVSTSKLDVSSRIPPSLGTAIRQFCQPEANTHQLQRFVTSKLKSAARASLLPRTDSMAMHMKAILNSIDHKHANLIFRLLPTDPELSMSSNDWDQLLRARLAYPPDDNLPERCPHCGDGLSTSFAKTHHHHSCNRMMKLRTDRHNAVLDVVLRLARFAGYTTSVKQMWAHIDMPDELRALKPDASIIPGRARRRPVLLDVGITHPCAPTLMLAAAAAPLSAGEAMLNTKHTKYKDLATVISYDFIGLVMETYGAMVPEFRALVESLVQEAMRHNELSLAQAKQLQIHTFAAIAVALHRGNAAQARSMFQPSSLEDMEVHDEVFFHITGVAQM